MNLSNYWKARKAALNPARINLRNIAAVLQAAIRKLFRSKDQLLELSGFRVPQHIWEQTIWARIQVEKNSPKCWESGSCINCGCEILGKTLEDRACEKQCYPSKMSKENWEAYKRIRQIKLFQ